MRPMFYQISTMPAFKNKKMSNYNKISKNISNNAVCLPNGYNLNEKKIKKISLVFDKILNGKKK